MACGLPVVATDLPAIREYAPFDTAVYVPRDDAGGFTEAIIGLLSDQERRARMGTAARLRAGGYAWEVVGEGMREVYKQVWHEWKGGN